MEEIKAAENSVNQLSFFRNFGPSNIIKMHAARLDKSPRLRAVLNILEDGREHTSAELARATGSVAIGTDISELRANGIAVKCEHRGRSDAGRNIYAYRLGAA